MKVTDIGLEKARRCDGREMGINQFLSSFFDNLQFELKKIIMEQVREVQQVAIVMSLYCQKDERVQYMLRGQFVDNK